MGAAETMASLVVEPFAADCCGSVATHQVMLLLRVINIPRTYMPLISTLAARTGVSVGMDDLTGIAVAILELERSEVEGPSYHQDNATYPRVIAEQ